jgi:hypothetical protein
MPLPETKQQNSSSFISFGQDVKVNVVVSAKNVSFFNCDPPVGKINLMGRYQLS